jgi:enoyl-CoA hydratase
MSSYRYEHGIAHISLDDGKVNALGSTTIALVNADLDHTLRDDATAVILFRARWNLLCRIRSRGA